MRLDSAIEEQEAANATTEPGERLRQPRSSHLLATLLAMMVWPVAVAGVVKLLPPGGTTYALETDTAQAAADRAQPAVPTASVAGAGKQAGPAPFWVEPPAAKVQLKVIVPAEPLMNPMWKKSQWRKRPSRDAAHDRRPAR